MRIRVLRNLGQGLPNYREGQVRDVPDKEGRALVEGGLAEPLPEPPAAAPAPKGKLKAVPKADLQADPPSGVEG